MKWWWYKKISATAVMLIQTQLTQKVWGISTKWDLQTLSTTNCALNTQLDTNKTSGYGSIWYFVNPVTFGYTMIIVKILETVFKRYHSHNINMNLNIAL